MGLGLWARDDGTAVIESACHPISGRVSRSQMLNHGNHLPFLTRQQPFTAPFNLRMQCHRGHLTRLRQGKYGRFQGNYPPGQKLERIDGLDVADLSIR